MNKLKIFAITTLAAATVGVGSLVDSPSASARPNCSVFIDKALVYASLSQVAIAFHDYSRANRYSFVASLYIAMADGCLGVP